MTAHRREAIRLAKSQEKAVGEKCIRSGQDPPGYTFDELIGKGSFGRVYKGRQNSTGRVVAVKVLDIDEADFQAFGDMRDEQIRDFNKEIQILRRAQESGAENLNQMIEALPVHSQLWLICEYCPGGSVKTLMRATNDRLEEKYLIVVARELAKALKGLHQAGIMHRDVKAANVLIHENGGLQLCDFGIAAAIEGQTDKRRTFVGTLHWMPPELWADKPEYNDEVDVWGYGCTLFECATGTPPNSDVRERQQLKMRMRRLKQSIALPEKDNMVFSDGLRSLVKYALNPDAASRPSMHDILQHEFLADTEETYPKSSLTELVQHYYGWLFGGGQRISLFMPGGAVAASEIADEFGATATDEWNFSMTQEFEKRVSTILEIPDLSHFSDMEYGDGEMTPKAPMSSRSIRSPTGPMTATERANFELRVQRGEGLANLFDDRRPAYEYKQKRDFIPIKEPVNRLSDLPFRAMAEDRPVSAAMSIDLGDFDEDDYAVAVPRVGDDRIQTTYAAATPKKEEPAFILPDAATIRAKRADSKGPKEDGDRSLTAKRSSSAGDISDSTSDDWTARREFKVPSLDDPAEITPTLTKRRPKERDTMQWSFATAMETASEPSSPEPYPTPKQSSRSTSESPEIEQKPKPQRATQDWSFSMAMAALEEPEDGRSEMRTPGRHTRPTALLRTMTTPVTSDEVYEAYDDYSRPSTALSGAYSESSTSSTDFDPFALDKGSSYEEDGPGDAEIEIDDIDMGDFYATRGRTIIPPDMSGPGPDISGPGPDVDMSGPGPDVGMTITPHMNGHTEISNGIIQPGSPGTPVSARKSPRGPSSPRALGHIRGNGSGATRGHGSGSSTGSNKTSHKATGSVISAGVTSNGSGSVDTSVNGYMSRAVSLPIPAPPSLAAMAGDASPNTVQRELDRLLGEFQDALGVAGDIVGDSSRGRTRRRTGTTGSGSDWEDVD